MFIEQLYTGCLAEAAYYIESNGESGIIDPLRETAPYEALIAKRGSKLKYIFETHFHADFVSGHVDLAKKTGAQIVFGPTAKTKYEAIEATDGQIFQIGDITIEVLHTPGHTIESSTYLLKDKAGNDHCIFTGDTLFIGDVGRPDLAIKSDLSQEDLAGMLYDSLQSKIKPLADNVIVYPAHGAGSSCGKNLSDETFATLGDQKENNYALQATSREDFITELTTGIMPAPQYFPKNALLNKNGVENIDVVIQQGATAYDIAEFKEIIKSNEVLIIDTRSKNDFVTGFIPGSIFFGLDGSFAMWVGALITDINQKIMLVTNPGDEEQAVIRLARVGYDNTIGFLSGGYATWQNAGEKTDTISSISADELASIKTDDMSIVDSRKPGEFEASHICGAVSYPLDYINDHLNDLDKERTQYLHCKSGYRSVIAASILRREGYRNVVDVAGGFIALEQTSLKIVDNSCSVS